MLGRFKSKAKKMLSRVTVEPVMFLDGACHWSMQVFMEVVQMQKICSVSLGLSDEMCSNLTAHPEVNIQVQKEFSIFVFQNSIIMSILPLIFVLFMGSWSDKYGRKIPLIMTTLCHTIWSGGYLLNSWQATWPMEFIYLVTFFDSIGGGPQGLVSTSVAYISDVTHVETRTSRVSTALSLWYFGGPLGNLIGALAIQYGGIDLALAIVFSTHLMILCYVTFYIKESHGPFAALEYAQPSECTMKKEEITKTKMVVDFFNWRRVVEAFKTAFKSREGYTRVILLAVVSSNMIRRAARGFYMYPFVRRSLGWDAAIYTYWTSYRTMVAASGSLILVPVLTRLISITDPILIVVGSLSMIGEYCCYGFVSGPSVAFFIWLGPVAGLISNASIIAQKSLATKLVSKTEKGRVSAVMSATQSLMPMVGYAMYAPIYHSTVENFPEAQYFFAASLAAIIMITFLCIHLSNIAQEMKITDAENNVKKEEAVTESKSKLSSSISEKKNSSSNITDSIQKPAVKLGLEEAVEKKNVSLTLSSTLTNRDSAEKTEISTGDDGKEVACYENKMTDAEILSSENMSNDSPLAEEQTRETDQREKRRR